MSHLTRPTPNTPASNLCDLLLRDMASLLLTNELIASSMAALRPECEISADLIDMIDRIVATSEAGEFRLHEVLVEAGAVLPPAADTAASALVMDFFMRLPAATTPGVMAAEVAVNLRLLVQHIELKTRLAAEEAVLLGQGRLGQGLIAWAAEWRACGEELQAATMRARAQAYIADVDEAAWAPAI